MRITVFKPEDRLGMVILFDLVIKYEIIPPERR